MSEQVPERLQILKHVSVKAVCSRRIHGTPRSQVNGTYKSEEIVEENVVVELKLKRGNPEKMDAS